MNLKLHTTDGDYHIAFRKEDGYLLLNFQWSIGRNIKFYNLIFLSKIEEKRFGKDCSIFIKTPEEFVIVVDLLEKVWDIEFEIDSQNEIIEIMDW